MVWRVFKILLTVLFMQCVTVLSALAETPAIDYELWDKQAKYADDSWKMVRSLKACANKLPNGVASC